MVSRMYRGRIREALNNPNLKTALDRAVDAYFKARTSAFEGLDFESLRSDVRKCKEASVAAIPELFERFREEAEKVGVQVHQTSDAAEAVRAVLDIAESKGVRRIAKSKSMLTEEIDLNRHLIAAGLQVTETDLGEWICQNAGERPSHFTAPAIHKTREQIADLFSKITGEPVEGHIPALVEVARREIRRAFVEAEMGISGANLAIADTGTLVIVSNEGNARLVTSLPDIHVVLVGYEKLVPSLDEATTVLKLLSKSATGQKMTSYVSFITGPSRTSDIEKTLTLGCHGPREVHVIFVDNGRLEMADDPDFREALYCLKCGACLSACPVYRSVGGHVFGHTYVGGIGAILAAFHAGLSDAEDIINICSTCRRCTSYCPAKIDIPRMIVALRRKLAQGHGQPWIERLVAGVLGNPDRFDAAMTIGRAAQKMIVPGRESIERLPYPFSGLTRFRSLPTLAAKPLADRVPTTSHAQGTKLGTVAFFPGCVIEQVFPEIGESVVRVLARLGWEVLLPNGRGCCGIPAYLKGDAETARKLAIHNLAIPDFAAADFIITACPTCATALKEHFPSLLENDPERWGAALALSEKVRDFSEFLINVYGAGSEEIKGANEHRTVTYHDPCHAVHRLGIFDEPRKLLGMAGCEIVEMADSDACCGFAGTYSISYPEVSESILRRKLENIAATGASTVVSDCPGCILQLRGALKKAGSGVEVRHTAEILG